MSERSVHVHISGTVQGVWFRESTKQEAERLGVRGWVQNLSDGRVEGVFQGASEVVDALLQWCHRGPERAQVEHVAVDERSPVEKFEGFEVRR